LRTASMRAAIARLSVAPHAVTALRALLSKRTDRRYLPSDRGVWLKSKCLCVLRRAAGERDPMQALEPLPQRARAGRERIGAAQGP
jgi:hypothetical protein